MAKPYTQDLRERVPRAVLPGQVRHSVVRGFNCSAKLLGMNKVPTDR